MSTVPSSPRNSFPTPSPDKTLRRLFLTVFLRGQSARGLTKDTAPKSVASKLWVSLAIYGVLGSTAFVAWGQPILLLSVTLHSLTFMCLGMFVATSAGEALFNKEEAEILMHRPVTSQMVLRAKATVLAQISMYLAGALNFVGLLVGLRASDEGLLFPVIHLISTVEEALFSVGLVVLLYQICLRWFGRERLEGVMTTMQVLFVVSITIGSQILPRAIGLNYGLGSVDLHAWWLKCLPPTWFASFDDALAGSGSRTSWSLAALGLVATAATLGLAFGKLASGYEKGVQNLNESVRAQPKLHFHYRLVKSLSQSLPLRWFLRDSVSKASFQLVSAYMFRDRDTKLRLYPGIAPMMIMPVTMLASSRGFGAAARVPGPVAGFSLFYIALSAAYLCLVPLSALNLLKFSQQWRAADVFVASPISGPARILQGARVAVVFFLTIPMVLVLTAFWLATSGPSSLLLILPGVIAMPVYTLIPGVIGNATPLSNPLEEAKSAANWPIMMLSMMGAFVLAGLATAAAAMGVLPYFLALETAASAILCLVLSSVAARSTWRVYD